jgi:hypothetical protein
MADPKLPETIIRLKTTDRGLLSEQRVQLKLLEMGVHVMTPLGQDHPFDLVAYHAGEFSRIQVKTARDGKDKFSRSNGTIMIPAFSTIDRKGGKFTKILTAEDCDVIVGYYPRNQSFYVVLPGKHQHYLRYSDQRHTANEKTRLAVDYELRTIQQLFPHTLKSNGHVTDTRPDDHSPYEKILPLFQ